MTPPGWSATTGASAADAIRCIGAGDFDRDRTILGVAPGGANAFDGLDQLGEIAREEGEEEEVSGATPPAAVRVRVVNRSILAPHGRP